MCASAWASFVGTAELLRDTTRSDLFEINNDRKHRHDSVPVALSRCASVKLITTLHSYTIRCPSVVKGELSNATLRLYNYNCFIGSSEWWRKGELRSACIGFTPELLSRVKYRGIHCVRAETYFAYRSLCITTHTRAPRARANVRVRTERTVCLINMRSLKYLSSLV